MGEEAGNGFGFPKDSPRKGSRSASFVPLPVPYRTRGEPPPVPGPTRADRHRTSVIRGVPVPNRFRPHGNRLVSDALDPAGLCLATPTAPWFWAWNSDGGRDPVPSAGILSATAPPPYA